LARDSRPMVYTYTPKTAILAKCWHFFGGGGSYI